MRHEKNNLTNVTFVLYDQTIWLPPKREICEWLVYVEKVGAARLSHYYYILLHAKQIHTRTRE